MNHADVISSMTASELAIAERAAGMSLTSFDDPNIPTVPLMGALAWVVEKRSNPTLTYQQFMDTHTIDQINTILGADDEDDEGKD